MDRHAILIIDDDHNLSRTLSHILASDGFETLTAENGRDGLSLLEQHSVRLALVDLKLPDLSGIEVLGRIKEYSPSTEAIILTGNATLTSAIEATNSGAFSYVVKPCDIGQLMLHIRRAIEKSEAEEKLARHQQDLEKKNSELKVLYEVSLAINRTIEVEGLLSGVLRTLLEMELFRRDGKGAAFVVEGSLLHLVTHIGLSDGQVALCSSRLNMDCLCGVAASDGEILISYDSEVEPHHVIRYPGMPQHGHVILPLKAVDRVVGVIALYIRPDTRISEPEIMLLTTLANQIGVAVNNARLYEEAKTGSLHDHLTGLPNRRFLQLQIEKNIEAARRYGEFLSVIILDIDHFKNYNDTRGHVSGDRLLVELAGILSRETRSSDFVSRYGGEEFLVILPRTDAGLAYDAAERLRAVIEESTDVTVSLGVASYRKETADAETLIRNADDALYRAKRAGRNRARVEAVPDPSGGADRQNEGT